jgi:hypothetical protein
MTMDSLSDSSLPVFPSVLTLPQEEQALLVRKGGRMNVSIDNSYVLLYQAVLGAFTMKNVTKYLLALPCLNQKLLN